MVGLSDSQPVSCKYSINSAHALKAKKNGALDTFARLVEACTADISILSKEEMHAMKEVKAQKLEVLAGPLAEMEQEYKQFQNDLELLLISSDKLKYMDSNSSKVRMYSFFW